MTTVVHPNLLQAEFLGGAHKRIHALADRVREDISQRGLRPGDRYLTSEQTAQLLDVSTGTAHRVMRLLVDKKILARHRKLGTYVGSEIEPNSIGVGERRKIYVLSPSDISCDASGSNYADAYFPQIFQARGQESIQLEYLPSKGVLNFMKTLADEAQRLGNLAGFILQRSTYEIQEFFQNNINKYPTIVGGNVFPGITQLPSIGFDQYAIGKSVAEYLIRRNHKRVAILMNNSWAAGDNTFIKGFIKTVEQSGHKIDQTEICSLPAFENAVEHRIHEVLATENRPTAIIGRVGMHILKTLEVAARLNLSVPGDVNIVLGNLGINAGYMHNIPHVAGMQNPDEIGEIISRVLSEIQQRQVSTNKSILCPIIFVDPEMNDVGNVNTNRESEANGGGFARAKAS